MATSTLRVIVETNTRQLDQLTSKFKKTETQVAKLQGKIKGPLANAFNAVGRAGQAAGRKIKTGFDRAAKGAAKLQGKLGGLRSTLLGLGVGAGLGVAVNAAASFEQTQLRLKLLSKEYGEFDRIQKLVTQNATTFNQSQKESAENFANVYARLRPLGKSLDEIQTTYEGFNAVAIASGASAQEASSAFLQLSQALGSGRLQGDEFRSISEQVPGILQLVSKEMNVTVGELKKLGSEGKITSDILINALAKGFDKNKDSIAQLIALSPAQKFKAFQNATSELSVAVGQELLPALIPLVTLATDLLKLFGQLPGPIKTTTVAVVALGAAALVLAPALGAVGNGLAALGAAKLGAAAAGVTKLTLAFTGLKLAMLAVPWVAAGAAIAGLIGLTVNYYQKQAELNSLLSGSETNMSKYETAIKNTNDKLAAAKSKLNDMETAGVSNARAINAQKKRVQELKAQLEGIRGTYTARVQVLIDIQEQSQNIAGIDYKPDGPGGRLVPINPPETVTQKREREAREAAEKLKNSLGNSLGGGGGGGGGGGAAPATDDLEALQGTLDLAKKLQPFQDELNASKIIGNDEAVRANEIAIERIELIDSQKNAVDALNTAEGKSLQNQINSLELARFNKDAATEQSVAYRASQKAIEDALRPLKEQRELLEAQLNGTATEVSQRQEIDRLLRETPGLTRAQVTELVQGNAALQEQVDQAKELEELYGQIGQRIASGIVDGIMAAVDGSKDLQEVLQGVLKDLGRMLLQFGVNRVFSKLDIPGFADGGRPELGEVSIVGERGPELFVPDEAGTVLSNEDSKAVMSRYSMRNGGPSGGNGADGANGADATSGAVSVNYNGPTLTFNSDDYLPVSAVPGIINAAAQRGAEQGNAKTLGTLKNSRSQRSKLGMR